MKKMPAFFHGYPGGVAKRRRRAKKAYLPRLTRFVLRTNALTPTPLPQAGEGILFVFSAIFAIVEMADTYASLWQAAQFCRAQMFHKNSGRLSAVRIGKDL